MNNHISTHHQIPLDIGYKESPGFDQFNPGENRQVFTLLKKIAAGSENGRIYLWGPTGTGKSHLLQAACLEAGENKRSAVYIPLANYRDLQPLILEGMENMNLLCIDDVDGIAGNTEWEQALFHLYNRVRDVDGSMIFTSKVSPKATKLELQDLRSRMGWDLVFHLQPLSEPDRIDVLKKRAQLRGFELPDEVANFLVKRVKRDFHSLIDLLDHLDRGSLSAKRKLTIPFVKELINEP